jgi:peptidoglycan-N-acetylglucosamine deacetylase
MSKTSKNRRIYQWIKLISILIIATLTTILIHSISTGNLILAQADKNGKTTNTNTTVQTNAPFRNIIYQLQEQAKNLRLTFAIPKQFQSQVIEGVTVNPKQKVVALTFDDGPYLQWTEQILDILKKEKIKATFFVIGNNLKAYPQIAKKVVAEGHAIGNHTWHHWYHKMSPEVAAKEIENTTKLIYDVTGVKTSLFRPPGGFLNNGVANYAKQKKYLVAMWAADSKDYSRPGVDKMVNNVMKEVRNGGMILMHDGGGDRSQTVKAVPILISKLKKQGYKFVTVGELLTMAEKTPQIATSAKKPAKTN